MNALDAHQGILAIRYAVMMVPRFAEGRAKADVGVAIEALGLAATEGVADHLCDVRADATEHLELLAQRGLAYAWVRMVALRVLSEVRVLDAENGAVRAPEDD